VYPSADGVFLCISRNISHFYTSSVTLRVPPSPQGEGLACALPNPPTNQNLKPLRRGVVPFASLTANLLRKCCRRSQAPPPTGFVGPRFAIPNPPINQNLNFYRHHVPHQQHHRGVRGFFEAVNAKFPPNKPFERRLGKRSFPPKARTVRRFAARDARGEPLATFSWLLL